MGKVMASLHSDIIVRSEVSASEGVDDYNFRFVGVDGYATSPYYRYGQVSWPMDWYFGLYRLEAESCTRDEAVNGYGRLRYDGTSQPFTVLNDQIATITVDCTVANIRIAAQFDDKLYEAFEGFRFQVSTVPAPIEQEDGTVILPEQLPFRTLELDAINKYGYFNLHDVPVNVKYTLLVLNKQAEVYVPKAEGYFAEGNDVERSVVNRGDVITFNINFTGNVQVTNDIKFIVKGKRTRIKNSIDVDDYTSGSTVQEDK